LGYREVSRTSATCYPESRNERELAMIEYEDGDSDELRHKTVERCIITADTAIDQLKRLTRSRLQAKTAVQNNNNQPTMESTTNELPPHHAMAVFDETTGKMLKYRHLIKHKDPEIRKNGNSQEQMNLEEQCKEWARQDQKKTR
jgi:hypothetical protein